MKITSITATDEHGVEHTFEGVVGWLRVRSTSKKGEPYVQAVEAQLTLAPIEIKPGT